MKFRWRPWRKNVAAEDEPITFESPKAAIDSEAYRVDIESQQLFDTVFYASHSPDVIDAGVDPLTHFLRYGHLEGRWPNPRFDPDFYRSEHLGGNQRINPLIHYLLKGRSQGLPTCRSSARAGAEDVARISPSAVADARCEARAFDDFRAFCVAAGVFDEAFYRDSNPDVVAAGDDAFEHFTTHGWKEGRDPSRVFSLEWYRGAHLDGDTETNPLRHFYESGVYRNHSPTHGVAEDADIVSLRQLSRVGRFVYPESPEVTLAVINFNGVEHLVDLVASLERLDYSAYGVMVVDNGSSDGSVAWLRANAPDVRIVELSENIGFADAVNVAFDLAPTQLVAILNNDMVVDAFWLRGLVDALRASPQRAAATSKLRFFKPFVTLTVAGDRPFALAPATLLKSHAYKKFFVERGRKAGETVASDADHTVAVKLPFEPGVSIAVAPLSDADGAAFAGTLTVRLNGVRVAGGQRRVDLVLDPDQFGDSGRWVINNAGSHEISVDVVGDRGFGQYDEGQFDRAENVDYLCGGSFLVNRSALRGRPLFIGDLFAYYEDTELSVRLRQDGYRIGYAPASVAYHKHASTSQESSIFFRRMVERNYSAFYARKRGPAKAVAQIARKKSHLNHLAHVYATNPNSTERERSLAQVYPEVMRELDTLRDAVLTGSEFHGSHRALRLGVYNSYWATAGGGELHALNIAVYLSRFGVVDLIAESDFNLEFLFDRFNLPQHRFRKVLLASIAPADTAAYDVFVNSTFASNLVSCARYSYYIVSFPHQWATDSILNAYRFLPNSRFTNHWCAQLWGEHASTEIVYPLVRPVTRNPEPNRKARLILHVGRFFPDAHCKMQHEIVETFRQITATHGEFASWKLVCVGGVDRTRDDCSTYFDEVVEAARGANIEFRPDAGFEELKDLYETAALYWHATGFGKNVDETPHDFEHFGISTVEAMSAGCIPIVLDAGGQSEIVADRAFGSRFEDRASWIAAAVHWMERFENAPESFASASRAAVEAAATFQEAPFRERVGRVFAEVEQLDAAVYRSSLSPRFRAGNYWRLRDGDVAK